MGQTVLDTLAGFDMFDGVSAAKLTELGITPRMRSLGNGQLLFERNDPALDVYFICEGRLLVVFFTEDGREVTFSSVSAGQYLGELSALDDLPRSLSVYAQGRAKLVALSQSDFLKLIDALPGFRRRVMRNLVALIRRLTERSYQGTAMNVETRLRSYLVRLALEQGAMRRGGTIASAPTHSEIASLIGANREAVSRAISFLKKSGVIDAGRKRLQILQPDNLLNGLDS